MKENIKNAIEEYQCSGCVSGCDISCFGSHVIGVGCGKHYAGTMLSYVGNIFLGLPKGFNRLGNFKDMKPRIFENFEGSQYDKFNVPVWKYLTENGHTLVRGISPRINAPFIDIYLENCIDKIQCLEITESDIEAMD